MATSTVRTREQAFGVIVRRVDPEFDADRRREPEYQFTGRIFTANRATRHPYDIPDEA